MTRTENEALAKITVGVPGVLGAEIPIRGEQVSGLRRLWFAPLDLRVRIVGAAVRISANEDDAGRLEVDLTVANFLFCTATVHDFHIEYVTIANGGLSEFPITPSRPEFRIPARSSGLAQIVGTLDAPRIRHLIQTIQPGPSKRSSPVASIDLRGSALVSTWRGSKRASFSQFGCTPWLYLNSPGARAAGA